MKRFMFGILAATFGLTLTTAEAAVTPPPPKQEWSFDGIFGTFDRAALQRGLQVYREVCSGCHSLRYVAFRNLVDLGYNQLEIKTLAAEATVIDGPDDDGEMFERDGIPSDYFPSPFPNAKAASAANAGASPPDLSLIAKARKGGPDYVYAILTGYEELPENWKDLEEYDFLPRDFRLQEGLSFNRYFPGHQIAMADQIAMAAPLAGGVVEYADGTEATIEQMGHDVSTFLMWTAEPKLEVRKAWGVKVMIFVFVMTVLLYFVKRKVWAGLH
jgi:ubiquinol-cytochrome c reductase cytochrome c1 subunit